MGLAEEADSYAEHADELNAVALTQQAIRSPRPRQSIGPASDPMDKTRRRDRIGARPGTEKNGRWRFR